MIEAAMIWNEPNNKSHWDFEIDPEWTLFARMATLAADAIQAEKLGMTPQEVIDTKPIPTTTATRSSTTPCAMCSSAGSSRSPNKTASRRRSISSEVIDASIGTAAYQAAVEFAHDRLQAAPQLGKIVLRH